MIIYNILNALNYVLWVIFYARTAELEDFVEVNNVADSTNNPEYDVVALIEAGFCLNRSSKDNRSNNAGYKLLELC